uniref:Uncharacterized protein n=1 Tax=Anguilla anguilla TaxID=7936 RepID=A0A0E9U4U1_ANGAN
MHFPGPTHVKVFWCAVF